MAYGVRWFSEFDDIQENVKYRTEILDRDYTGTATQVLSGETPFLLETTGSDDVYDPIRSQKATIEWISDTTSNFNINDLFITDDKKYQVAFWKYVGNTLSIIWRGYVVPIDCEEPFQSKPYPVMVSATCGLPFLRDTTFLDIGGAFVQGKLSLIKIISSALSNTGLSLDIHTYIDLYEQDMNSTSSPLAQAEIDADGLRGEDGYDVLAGILAPFGAFVVQVNGKWVIQGVREQTNFNGNLKAFNSNGDPISSGTFQRAASFGRTKYGASVPHVRPQANVVQRLAEPNSIVTETVSPGIAVNRLSNGTFSGVVIGGVIPGWRNQIKGGVVWAREGFGTPDDPYRLVFRSPVFLNAANKKKTRYPITPDAFFDTGPIEINVGDFNLTLDERPDLKVIFSGVMKSNNNLGALFFVTINESERKAVSFLDENGEWKLWDNNLSTPLAITPNGKPYSNVVKTLDELDYKRFEIESHEITNYLKVGGNGVAQIRVRIYPGPRFPGQIENNSLLSIEDLALVFTTGTAYEGEHKYQVDGNLPIRNANEVEYTTIIADKIGIDTPEQERDVNRVMTGYMTITGTNNLTSAWIRSGDNIFEPIQKKSLRERIRLLCGKRRVIEGSFVGYDLRPDQPVFNRYDNLGAPSQFFTQTGFKWDVKQAYFDCSFHELDFTPLANEEIYLFDDEGGRRGNRMYGGTSGTSKNSGSIKTNEEILIGTLPPIYYTVGQGDIIKVIDLAPYIESSHKPEDLEAAVKHYTDWVSNVFIERGDTGKLLEVHITANPPYAGTDRVLVELTDENGNKNLVAILLIAVAESKFKYELFDTSAATPKSLGFITEGSGFKLPTSWIIQASVKGYHQAWYASVNGPGLNSNVTPTPYLKSADHEDDITYRLPTTGSYISQVGTYVLNFATFRYEGDENNYTQVKGEVVNFVLYDDAYLNKVKFELWSGGEKLGDINPDGSSAFNTEGAAFDVYAVLAGLPHNTASLVLKSKGVTLKTTNFTQATSQSNITYKLYNAVANPAQPKGLYELTINTNNTSPANTYNRMIAFTINEKEVTPKAGVLKLIAAIPNTTNYTTLGTLAAEGGSYTLPANGWNILNDSNSELFDYEEYKLFQLKSTKLVEVDIELYTGQKQFVNYAEPLTQSNYRIFGNENSLDIDSIHGTPSTFRIVGFRRLGGVSGDLVEKYSSDFSFGPAVDITDTPVTDDTGGTGTGVDMDDVDQAIADSLKKYMPLTNVSVGNTVPIYFGDLNAYNFTGIAILGSSSTNIPNSVPGMLISGVNGSNMSQLIVTRSGDNSYYRGTNSGAMGTWFQVASREWVNLKEVNTGTGLLGGGPIATDLTLTLDTDYTDARYLSSASTGIDWLLVNTNSKPKFNTSSVNSPAGSASISYHGIYINHATNANIGTSIAFRNNAGFFRSVENGTWGSWLQFADRDWVNAKQIIAGNGLIGGGTLAQDRTLALGLPSTLNSTSTNNVTSTSHSHAIDTGSLIQGNNVILSGTLTDRLIGLGNVTISVNQFPFINLTNLPTTLAEHGITNGVTSTQLNTALGGKENTFNKGNLVAGSNITFSGSGVGRLVGSGDLVINVTGVGGTNNIDGFGLDWDTVNSDAKFKNNTSATNGPIGSTVHGIFVSHGTNVNFGSSLVFRNGAAYLRSIENGTWTDWEQLADRDWTNSAITTAIAGKENAFAKGNIIQGSNVTISGNLIGRLVGSGNITINATATGGGSVSWDDITNKPTTLSGYGITDAYTQAQINNFFAGYVPNSRTLTINGVSYDLSQNRSWTINTGGGGGGTTISGGTKDYLAKFNAAGDNIVNSSLVEAGGTNTVFAQGNFSVLGLTSAAGGLRLPRGSFASLPETGQTGQIYYAEGNPGAVFIWTAAGAWRALEWSL